MPSDRTSAQQLERALSVLANREDRARIYGRLAQATGLDLDPFSTWMLIRLGHDQPVRLEQLAKRLHVPPSRLEPALDRLVHDTCIRRESDTLALTSDGAAAYAKLVEQRRAGLRKLLHGWPPQEQAEMAESVRGLAERLLSDDFSEVLAGFRTRLRTAQKT